MIYFIIAALIVLFDQLVKYLLSASMLLGEARDMIPGFIHLVYVRNTGAAFSFMSDMRWVLVVITFIVLAVVVWVMLRHGRRFSVLGRLGLAFVLGGAFSNFIDRALFGYVADFFEFQFMRFAVFNVADIFITVGGIVFCLVYLFRRDDLNGDMPLFPSRKKSLKAKSGAESDASGQEDELGSDDR